jgi:hypothetical protein
MLHFRKKEYGKTPFGIAKQKCVTAIVWTALFLCRTTTCENLKLGVFLSCLGNLNLWLQNNHLFFHSKYS